MRAAVPRGQGSSSLRGGVREQLGHIGKTGETNETSGQAVSPHSGKVEEARPGEALESPAALNPEASLQSQRAQGCPHIC